MLLCDALNDSTVKVRANACFLLGSFVDCPAFLLMQTLSKKMMTSVSEYLGKSNALKENDSGDFEMEVAAEFDMTNFSKCGEFIHGLEDEFEVVRSAAVSNQA